MQSEMCIRCGGTVKVMCQLGTGFCSQSCEDSATELWRANYFATVDEFNKGLLARVS